MHNYFYLVPEEEIQPGDVQFQRTFKPDKKDKDGTGGHVSIVVTILPENEVLTIGYSRSQTKNVDGGVLSIFSLYSEEKREQFKLIKYFRPRLDKVPQQASCVLL